MKTTFNHISFSLLIISTFLTIFVYWNGLNSVFLFDDIPNMNTIGQYSHLGFWRDIGIYILEGNSGSLGRPLSLASFYINDQTWQGMSPFDFKYTSLMFHLLNGLLIYWMTFKISNYINLKDSSRNWLPLIVCMLWLINPMQTNTVLYAVQRMTILSTTFTLAGIIFYIYGREVYKFQPKRGMLLAFFITYICIFFGILSKENAILTIVFIIILEYSFLKRSSPLSRKFNLLFSLFYLLPFFLLLIMLIKWGWVDQHSREFDTNERLLTEARILLGYVKTILIPSMNGSSLIQDDIIISRNLMSPFNTAPSVLIIISLLFICITGISKNRHLGLCFGALWFFGGHLLESTTVSLELYFEHRNYLPMYGLLFTISYYSLFFIENSKKLKNILKISLPIYISLTIFCTFIITQRWANPANLIISWLEQHPQSPRLLEALDSTVGEYISPLARKNLQNELDKSNIDPSSASYLAVRNLNLKCKNNTIQEEDITNTLNILQKNKYSVPLPSITGEFLESWQLSKCGNIEALQIDNFIEKFINIKSLQNPKMVETLKYWQGEVKVELGKLDDAMIAFDFVYANNKDINLLLRQAIYLSTAGLYNEALNRLDNADKEFCDKWRTCFLLKMRQPDIDNLRASIIKQQQESLYDQAIHHPSS